MTTTHTIHGQLTGSVHIHDNSAAGAVERLAQEAQQTVAKERDDKARHKLETLFRQKAAAEQVVRNIDAQIADTKASLIDGSFQ